MKIDLKKTLLYFIGFFLLISLFFNIKSCNRESFEKLEQKNNKLEKVRDSLRYANQNLKKDFIKIQDVIDKRDIRIMELQIEIDEKTREIIGCQKQIVRYSKDLEETNRKIDILKKNPIKRDDDELIDSFKNKLKRP